MDRRVPIFAILGLVAAALVPFSTFGKDDFRWVAAGTAGVYFLLAALVLADWLSRRGRD